MKVGRETICDREGLISGALWAANASQVFDSDEMGPGWAEYAAPSDLYSTRSITATVGTSPSAEALWLPV